MTKPILIFIIVFLTNYLSFFESFSQNQLNNINHKDIVGKRLVYGELIKSENRINDGCEFCGGDIFFINNDSFIDRFSNLEFYTGKYLIIKNQIKLQYDNLIVQKKYENGEESTNFNSDLINQINFLKSDLNEKNFYGKFPSERILNPDFKYLKKGITLELINKKTNIYNRTTSNKILEYNKGIVYKSDFQDYTPIEIYNEYKNGLFRTINIPFSSVYKFSDCENQFLYSENLELEVKKINELLSNEIDTIKLKFNKLYELSGSNLINAQYENKLYFKNSIESKFQKYLNNLNFSNFRKINDNYYFQILPSPPNKNNVFIKNSYLLCNVFSTNFSKKLKHKIELRDIKDLKQIIPEFYNTLMNSVNKSRIILLELNNEPDSEFEFVKISELIPVSLN